MCSTLVKCIFFLLNHQVPLISALGSGLLVALNRSTEYLLLKAWKNLSNYLEIEAAILPALRYSVTHSMVLRI